MRTAACIGIVALLVAGLASLAAATRAESAGAPDIPVSDLLTPEGKSTTLRAHLAYQASQFPIPLRVTTPDGSWSGAQWKTSLHNRGRPPFYGWVAVGQGPTSQPPRGLIVILTADAPTPSVTTTVAGLRSRGTGATYEPTSPIKLAGFPGIQFDGTIDSTRGHTFVPFTPPTGAAGGKPDSYTMFDNGEVFRIIVLNARGKTVVVFLESLKLPPDQFPNFLTRSNRILESLRFPG